MLQQRLEYVRQRIQQACQRAGRSPESVTLVAVTKGVPIEAMREAIALGVRDIGENRVQESSAKRLALGSGLEALGSGLQPTASSLQPVRWHLIGHVQRNKAKRATELFQVIHSVDSSELAEALDRHAADAGRITEVFMQVNVSGEATKFGCRPDDAVALGRTITQLPHLKLTGLMTIAPFAEDPETVRPVFRQLRALRDRLQQQLVSQSPNHLITQLQLSMGMSHDFEVAIEEGADMVRIGTAIFGQRD